MKWLKFVRTLKEGVTNFYRNGSLTLVTVVVLSVVIYAISAALVFLYISNIVLADAQDRFNISIMFKSDVSKERIMSILPRIEEYEGVKSVKFLSKEEALEDLKSANYESLDEALASVEGNPLGDQLIVIADSPRLYEGIDNEIKAADFVGDIRHTTFKQNKDDMENISRTIGATKKGGLIAGVVFVIIGILVTFNTVKLTIYSHRQEFEIMRLVGASNIYIKMPFVFEGMFYGLASGLVVMLLLFASAYSISPMMSSEIPDANALKVFKENFFLIFAGVLGSGILIGMLSSFIAIRKYLKV